MEAVKNYDRYVQKYLKRTNRLKTLEEFKKCLKRKEQKDERKPIKLTFAIQRAPERKTRETVPVEKKQQKSAKKDKEEKKTDIIPDKFFKIAKKFGLPEEHVDFFYENRGSFHWESQDKTEIHCSEVSCKFTMKASKGCLLDHMKTVHNYYDIPCDKDDCNYIAYSEDCFRRHQASFHGHGQKVTDYGVYPCPYSCKVSFRYPCQLDRHLRVHENRVVSCSYCQYRSKHFEGLQTHLKIHFNIKDYTCEICNKKYATRNKMKVHERTVHAREDFVCNYCNFSTPKHRAYKIHRLSCKERLKHSRIL